MSIPSSTRQLVGLGELATRVGVTRAAVQYWWQEGKVIGRVTGGCTRRRVVVPIEVVDFYLRYFRLPNKRELFERGALTREYLADLAGPDGGLEAAVHAAEPAQSSDGSNAATQ